MSRLKNKVDFTGLGYYRVASVCPKLSLGDPKTNAQTTLEICRKLVTEGVQVAVFPELGLGGYTVDDLNLNDRYLKHIRAALKTVREGSKNLDLVFVVGAPFSIPDGRLFNCAFVIHGGKILGAVPKTYRPNYGEYYEKRWFSSGKGLDLTVDGFRICSEQIFSVGEMVLGIEICEDLWAPIPPSSQLALKGANVILNLSASNDLVGKAEYRRDLVKNQSARLNAAYVYASAGPWESTKDMVFGGHLMIAENGSLLSEAHRFSFESHWITAEIDVEKLLFERRRNVTFGDQAGAGTASLPIAIQSRVSSLKRTYSSTPFVPDEPTRLKERAENIFEILSTGLARRWEATHSEHVVLGLSGGLDSTLAVLIAMEAAKKIKRKTQSVIGVGMPGFGTTEQTRLQAKELAKCLGIKWMEIPIHKAVEQHFNDIDHDPNKEDIVFENAQARERTQILFDLANKHKAFVVGTGDLSELWLGWCTFNADQMSQYNVNVSVPKTLVKHLVSYYATHRSSPEITKVLEAILDTPISPELKRPGKRGEIVQKTEDVLGPYLVHDFYLYHHLRNGFGMEKLFQIARATFTEFDDKELKAWLQIFFDRGYKSQFKRTTLPPGPKVGSVSISPRGDLRLPDELSGLAIFED